MRISYIDPLVRGWERMKTLLLEPFDLSKWFIIGFAAWLAGLLRWGNSWLTFSPGEPPEIGDVAWGAAEGWRWLVDNPWWLPVVGIVVLLSLALFALLLWLDSRGKMVFLDTVVRNQAAISEPWQRLNRLGDSLFLWRLGFSLACGVVAVLLSLVLLGPAAAAHGADVLSGLSFAAIILSFLVIGALSIVTAYALLFLDSFIVPIMYKFRLSATEAWRYFLPWLSRYGGWFLLYGLFVLVLAIGFGLALSLTCCLCGVGAIPYIGTVALLPFHVTYRLFSLYFLAQLDPAFDLLAPPPAQLTEG